MWSMYHYLTGYVEPEEVKEVEADPKQVRLRHVLHKQIKDSKIKLVGSTVDPIYKKSEPILIPHPREKNQKANMKVGKRKHESRKAQTQR